MKANNGYMLKSPVQLINIVQAEIFQPYVVDAILVIARDDGVTHNDYLAVRVVYTP